MKFPIPFLIVLIFTLSCKNSDKKAKAEVTGTYDKNVSLFHFLIKKCDEVRIMFRINPNRNEKGVYRVAKTLSDKKEIARLKDFISGEIRKDTCGSFYGILSFRKDSVEMKGIDFSLKPSCPSFYFSANGRFIAYKMTYKGGQYLSNLE